MKEDSMDYENDESPSASNLTPASTSLETNGNTTKRSRKNYKEQPDDTASDISNHISTRKRVRRVRDPNTPKMKPGRKSFEEHRRSYKDKLLQVWNAASDLKVGCCA